MKKPIKANVSWVGKVDWEIRNFHGYEYSTWKGTSYNSYLVQEEKTALIDTVWKPFAKEFVDGLERDVGLKKIDYVIANHAEIDHSGSLPELLSRRPDLPVYCTANGVKFVEAPMLHWPDSMMCYLTGDAVVFSNDAFGQHYATELLFNDLVDRDELYDEAIKYYANILTPFSPLVTKKIDEVVALKLPIDMICPSHGVIWRKEPLQIVQQYAAWAKEYREDRVAIVYDTMWDGTRRLAEAAAQGITEASPSTTVVLHNVSKSDKNDVITDVFRSKGVLFGSPTVNKGILTAMAGLLEEIRGLNFKGKKAGAFGCYGWSGESPAMLAEAAKAAGFELAADSLKALWAPDETAIAQAVEFGKKFAKSF
jgi:flavorubredoxin